MLANPSFFNLTAIPEPDREAEVWEQAESVQKKPAFALKYAITRTNWKIPRYILEGLQWLSAGTPAIPIAPSPLVSEFSDPMPPPQAQSNANA